MAKIDSLKKKRSMFDSIIVNARKAHEKEKKDKLEKSKNKANASSKTKSKTRGKKSKSPVNILEKYPDMELVNDWEELKPNDYIRYINKDKKMITGYVNTVNINGNSYVLSMRKRKSINSSNQFNWETYEGSVRELYKSKSKTQMSAQLTPYAPSIAPSHQSYSKMTQQTPETIIQLRNRADELERKTQQLVLKIDELILSSRHLHKKNTQFEKTLMGIIKHIKALQSR